MATYKRSLGSSLKGITKGSTLRFSPEVALELAVYGKAGHQQKDVIEKALRDYFDKNPLPKKVRDSAMVVLEHEHGVG